MPDLNRRPHVPVALAFAAVVLGFLGAAVYVPFALRPLTVRAEEVQHNLAQSIRHLSDVRGYSRDVRTSALLAYESRWDQAIDRASEEEAIRRAWVQLGEALQAYARLPRDPEEDRAWSRLTSVELPRVERAVAAALAPRRERGGDPIVVQQLLEAGTAADATTQQLIDINTGETLAESARIHAGLRRLSIGYVVLAALGTAGAIVLLLLTVGSIRRYARVASQRVAELEAFAGQISHDLRSPLQTIQLAVTSVERKAEDDAVRRLAGMASAGVRRVDAMIRDLLQFARSATDVREGAKANVRTVVDDLGEELRPVAERARVTLDFRCDDAVAAIAPVALKTILANLVENAIKYRREGADNAVELTARAADHGVEIHVADRGIGIQRELVPRVFEPFFRAAQRPDSYGLGLATVKRLVDAHRGAISVDSEEGRGTRFTITLPRAAPHERGGAHER